MVTRVRASSADDFIKKFSGKQAELHTVDGFCLSNNSGSISYVGLETTEGRPEQHLPALRSVEQGGGPRHPQLQKYVLGRFKWHYTQRNYVYNDTPVVVLEQTPRSFETGLAFAIEKVLGQDKSLGGVVALAPSHDYVQDCLTLLRLHDNNCCVCCGDPNHKASLEHCRIEDKDRSLLPYRTQQLMREPRNTLPPNAVLNSLATEIGNLTSEMKRRRTSSETQPSMQEPQPSQPARLAGRSWSAWECVPPPKLDSDGLRDRLLQNRIDTKHRDDIEAELGEQRIDLVLFATNVVYGEYTREKAVWKDARRVSDKDCRRSKAGSWAETTWRAHVQQAIEERRLSPGDYFVKRIVRKGNANQADGIAVRISTMLAVYS